VLIKGKRPTVCVEYKSYWSWPTPKKDTIEKLNEVLDHFEKDELQLALVYYEAIDAIGMDLLPYFSHKNTIMFVQIINSRIFSLTFESDHSRSCLGSGVERAQKRGE
jgi:hypothetical protein